MRHVYRMIDGAGPDLVIAHDKNEAWRVWCEAIGENRADYEAECAWGLVDPDEMVAVGSEDQNDIDDLLNTAARVEADLAKAKVYSSARADHFTTHGYPAWYIEAPAWWWAKMPAGVLLIGEW